MRLPVRITALVVALAVLGMTAACGQRGAGPSDPEALASRGPVTVWYSNNPSEVRWGKRMLDAWNREHPDQPATGQQIPAGKTSEEVIGAAITAGNAPCLVLNTAPSAVPQFQKQGGLVPLDQFPGGERHIRQRTGQLAEQYRSGDGHYYQLPWKSNPVMIFYNKSLFAQAGLDPDHPDLDSYQDFLSTARRVVEGSNAEYAIWPAPSSEFFQSWLDFYPLFAAESGGELLVRDGEARFDSAAGLRVARFWKRLYDEGLASPEQYNGDAFGDGRAAIGIAGPWAVAEYDDLDWGVVPVPTSRGIAAHRVHTFGDAKNIAIYSACQNRRTAWDLLRFATSPEQDGAFLRVTGQMPLRANLTETYPRFFARHPVYERFAEQSARTIDVPNVANSVEIWQTFRDAYSEAVIFGKHDPASALARAADEIEKLAADR